MNTNKSPALKHQPPSPYNNPYNKENTSSSPSKRKLAESNTSSSHLSSSEILNVAHRILNKNQSNSAMAVTQPKVMKTSNEINKESFSTGSISNIRSKFENKRNDSDGSILMTPKSIIKKFEQLSRDGGVIRNSNSNPVSAQTSLTNLKTSSSSLDSAPLAHIADKQQLESTVPSIYPNLKSIQNISVPPVSTANHIYSEHIHPKSIIEKFEQLVKNNGQHIQAIEVEQVTTIPKSISSNTNFSSTSDAFRGSGSLTYISSVISDTSPRDFDNDDGDSEEEEDDQDINDNTYKSNQTETDELYEEMSHDTETQIAYKDVMPALKFIICLNIE